MKSQVTETALMILDVSETDRNKQGYTGKQVVTQIHKESGNLIEVASTKQGYIIVEYTETSLTRKVVKGSILDTVRHLKTITGANPIVLNNSLEVNERAVQVTGEVFTPERVTPSMWTGNQWS